MKRCRICLETKPLSEFYKANGTVDGVRGECKPCNLAEKRAKTALNPQPNRDRVRAWALANPEKVKERVARMTGSERKKLVDRKSYLKRTYGLTIEQYEEMYEAQGGVCYICKKPRPEDRTLHVDHDHATGEIRGLLCFRCNNALGDFDDDYELLQNAADYLDRDPELDGLAQERAKALTR